MRTTVIRTKYSMGSGIVFISEANEAILGTYDTLLIVVSLVGKRVYVRSMYSVARTCELLAAKENIGR